MSKSLPHPQARLGSSGRHTIAFAVAMTISVPLMAQQVTIGTGQFGSGSVLCSQAATAATFDCLSQTNGGGTALINGVASSTASLDGYAQAPGTIAIGDTNTQAVQYYDIAIGSAAVASGGYSIALGSTAAAAGTSSIALGNGATAPSNDGIALGDGAVAQNTRGIYIGTGAGTGTATNPANTDNVGIGGSAGQNVNGYNNNAVGNRTGSNITGSYNLAFGTDAGSNVTGVVIGDNVALGSNTGNNLTGDFNLAAGPATGNFVTGSNNVALGAFTGVGTAGAPLTVSNTVAIGYTTMATADNAIAIGTNATASGTSSIAIGNANIVSGTGSGAIGDPNTITGNGSYAVGNNNTIHANNAFVLGSGVTIAAGLDGSVALGNGSTVAAPVATAGVAIGATRYTFAGATPSSVVSVGAPGSERQISNVAAGQISATSTDAINGSELYATNQALSSLANGGAGTVQYSNAGTPTTPNGGTPSQNLTLVGAGTGPVTLHNVAAGSTTATSTDAVNGGQLNTLGSSIATNLGGGATYNSTTGTVTAPAYTVQGATYNTVGGAIGAVNTDLSKLASGSAGTVQYSNAATPTTPNGGVATQNLTLVGATAAPVTLHNVAAGSASTDAVNVGQLTNAVSTAVGTSEAYTNSQLVGFQNEIEAVQRNADAGTASGMAMSGVPQSYLPGKTMVAAGVAGYGSEQAMALGLSKLSDNGRWVMKLNGSANTRGKYGAAVGAGVTW
jgi:trimeric autotransporter adhesin